jgi:anti-sigma-K factor RskA
MTDREDIDVLAAEYVLGTLDDVDRGFVRVRRQQEPDLDAAIADWERRLSPLMETVSSIRPRPDLFAAIEARLAVRRAASASAPQIVELQQRVRVWRRLALTAALFAACLLAVIGLRERLRPEISRSYVAVFQQNDASPAFLLTFDLETRVLSIRPLAAEAQPGKTYQLWIASEKLGGAPQSLGLIEDHNSVTRRTVASYDPSIVEHATFGISLEPAGGSPTGRPTGPAFHAKLIPSPR